MHSGGDARQVAMAHAPELAAVGHDGELDLAVAHGCAFLRCVEEGPRFRERTAVDANDICAQGCGGLDVCLGGLLPRAVALVQGHLDDDRRGVVEVL